MFTRIRDWFDPKYLREVGTRPDYRYTLANERTFLAWLRTALALVAGGLAAAQFLPELRPAYLRELIAIVLLALGGLVAIRAVDYWARVQKSMRRDEELPQSRFPAVMALAVGFGALALIGVVLFRGASGR